MSIKAFKLLNENKSYAKFTLLLASMWRKGAGTKESFHFFVFLLFESIFVIIFCRMLSRSSRTGLYLASDIQELKDSDKLLVMYLHFAWVPN